MDDYKEIFKLKKMLESEGIPFEFKEHWGGYQILYPSRENRICDVFEHNRLPYGSEQDKLGLMGLLTPSELEHDSVAGWLTAEDVFNRIKKHWKSTNCDIAQNLENCEDCGFCDMGVTEMPNELKPCPFCGATDRIRKVHIISRRLPWWWYIECDNCHYCGETKLLLRRAIKAWNKRINKMED